MIRDCNVSMSRTSVLCTLSFTYSTKKFKGVISEDLGGHGIGPFLPFYRLEKFHLKSHEPSNPSVEKRRFAETQPTAETLLIEEQRNISAYPGKCLL